MPLRYARGCVQNTHRFGGCHVPKGFTKRPDHPDHRRWHRFGPLHGPAICGAGSESVPRCPPGRAIEKHRNEIRAAGGKAAYGQADIRDFEAVEKAIEAAEKEFGTVDTLVNNAAGNFIARTEKLSPNAFNAVVGIVLQGTFFCTLALGKKWIARKQPGTILNIVATYASANSGSGFVVPSACAKAGVLALTRSLAVEWARHHIRLNAIAPGPFPTEGAWSRLTAFERSRRARQKLSSDETLRPS